MEVPQNIHSGILSAIRLLSVNREVNMDKAISIIEEVISDYDIDVYPDYLTGLAGIGCGIQYLIYSGLIDTVADEVLKECDQHLFSAVYFREHSDLSHATGLMGIASYFLGRLEDPNASEDNLYTVTNRTVLLSILDILLARFGVAGYVSSESRKLFKVNALEKKDVKSFIQSFLQCNICNELALRLRTKIEEENLLTTQSYDTTIETDMDDVTIIIPIRVDNSIRVANLKTIIRLYSELTNMHFIILEADKVQHIHIEENMKISYLFCRDENPVFHHTHYRNEMIKLAKTPIVVVWDVDILVPIEQLYRAINEVRRHLVILSYPYDGVCYCLSSDISDNFRDTLDWEMLASKKYKFQMMFGQLTVGGVFVIDREKYIQVGMENEYFVGWGPEDIERLKRLTILDFPVSRIDGCIYHLHHPRCLNSGYFDEIQCLAVKKELLRICKMSKLELLSEVNDWKWVI